MTNRLAVTLGISKGKGSWILRAQARKKISFLLNRGEAIHGKSN
jgi:hypothetical protein